MHAFIWQRAHHVDAVAYQYLVELAHNRFRGVASVVKIEVLKIFTTTLAGHRYDFKK
ncbi:hypothetical protein ALO43_100873 [Pseudomonas tremae]|uniref:Uncharacterized protein n=1 Tax=Pseudomonas tremae TaxID=200454 RepID=A0AA40P0H7_9PSED|nr:hypothetical protein ALO43_100873 [Pseudomonas tremae]RMO03087.1 hypothetical protein ALQ48_100144 [Pseudomonas coronafaciens pv. zizaniae]